MYIYIYIYMYIRIEDGGRYCVWPFQSSPYCKNVLIHYQMYCSRHII